MIVRLRIGRWGFSWSMWRKQLVAGVDSILNNGNHLFMADFDNVPFPMVRNALENTQTTYQLPPIYILETKKGRNYIAYCFISRPFRKIVEMVAYTKYIDWGFLRYGVFREKFTLRITEKSGRKPKLVHIIHSTIPEECYITDLKSVVIYPTILDGHEWGLLQLDLLEGHLSLWRSQKDKEYNQQRGLE